MDHIVLASQSPRRKQLLEWAEVKFEVMVSQSDETFPAGMEADDVAIHIARNKALAVCEKRQDNSVVIAADTIVVLGEEIIGKPRDAKDAVDILSRLAGHKHRVITGVAIIKGKEVIEFADTTEVWFHELTQDQIAYYVEKYQPFDKAGAYAIQEWIGVVGISRIEGDFYNVMGLPVSRVVNVLGMLGAI